MGNVGGSVSATKAGPTAFSFCATSAVTETPSNLPLILVPLAVTVASPWIFCDTRMPAEAYSVATRAAIAVPPVPEATDTSGVEMYPSPSVIVATSLAVITTNLSDWLAAEMLPGMTHCGPIVTSPSTVAASEISSLQIPTPSATVRVAVASPRS